MTSPRTIALSALAALALAAAPKPARAGEKIAVLVLGTSEKDAELADNLTEVLIAYVAQHGGFEIAGKEEFRARLGVENERRAQDCLDDISCLGRAGVSLGVRRIVAGSVGTRGKQFLFNLNLDDVEQGKVESRVFRLVEGGVEDLIHAVQEASGELFRPHVEPGKIKVETQPDGAQVSIDNAYLGVTPLISGTLLSGKHAVRVEADGHFPWASRVEVLPGQELQIKLSGDNLPRRRGWPPGVAYGTAIAAGAALAVGGFLGELSQLQPNGSTRQQAADDLDQKRHFATAATVSFVAAGVLAAVSLYHFIRYRDDIFGRNERYEEAP
ncbi:MAG TPA: PEGA domain-containing protein [Polyangia bacterium]|jgi:hypothetical protein